MCNFRQIYAASHYCIFQLPNGSHGIVLNFFMGNKCNRHRYNMINTINKEYDKYSKIILLKSASS